VNNSYTASGVGGWH